MQVLERSQRPPPALLAVRTVGDGPKSPKKAYVDPVGGGRRRSRVVEVVRPLRPRPLQRASPQDAARAAIDGERQQLIALVRGEEQAIAGERGRRGARRQRRAPGNVRRQVELVRQRVAVRHPGGVRPPKAAPFHRLGKSCRQREQQGGQQSKTCEHTDSSGRDCSTAGRNRPGPKGNPADASGADLRTLSFRQTIIRATIGAMPRPVLLCSSDPVLARELTHALAHVQLDGPAPHLEIAVNPVDGLRAVRRLERPVALVDAALPAAEDLLRALQAEVPTALRIAIAVDWSDSLTRTMRAAGAAHIWRRPPDPAGLATLLGDAPEAAAGARGGRLVCFLAAQSGNGASTLCLHAAHALGARHRRRAAAGARFPFRRSGVPVGPGTAAHLGRSERRSRRGGG